MLSVLVLGVHMLVFVVLNSAGLLAHRLSSRRSKAAMVGALTYSTYLFREIIPVVGTPVNK